ncbi:aspartate/glutamate racemase family protein [Aneurinibacillus terranovensis]|uniref:aspartate/glutamate racemase family protein n=1 Tax=Aneurinibacillus terranovensis TaxID=278991 RepID=UPI0004116149|nr:aspartate/glutamate racemase family protein [Aneurinibacillus terranovensis]
MECEYDEALCIPNLLEKAIEAEKDGYDGIISFCFGDPGVKPAREVLNIPVVGAAEASMLFASLLAKSFSVVTVLPNVVPMIGNISKTLGVNGNLASVRYVNIPVLEVNEKEKLKSALFEEMIKAIEEDKAHALVLGCTGMMGVAAVLQEKLKKHGYEVPVIDPAFAATKMLESVISMGVKQSRLTYMSPPAKVRL